MGCIYSFGRIVHGFHLHTWTNCTWVASIHLDLLYMEAFIHLRLLYMDGICLFGFIVPGWHLLIWTNCTCVSFTHMD